jgi:hypothetical protein
MSNYPTYEINACLLVSHVCSIKCFVLIFAQMEVGKRNDALKCFEYFLDLKNNREKTRLKTEKNAQFFDKPARGFFWFHSSVSKIKFYIGFINIHDFH